MNANEKIYEKLDDLVPNLQEWVSAALKYDGSAEEALKFKSGGMMDLNVDPLYQGEGWARIALSHYYKHPTGDMIADPDMQVLVNFEQKTASAETYQDMMTYDERDQQNSQSLDSFLNSWLSNIQEADYQQVIEQERSQTQS